MHIENIIDNLKQFINTNQNFSLLLLGVNSEFSNHHKYAEKLTTEINNLLGNDKLITHVSIQRLSDIEHSVLGELRKTGIIISSDIILDPAIANARIFIETPIDVLATRGETKLLDEERWKKFKAEYPIDKFIFDNVPFTFKSIDKIKGDTGAFEKILLFLNQFLINF